MNRFGKWLAHRICFHRWEVANIIGRTVCLTCRCGAHRVINPESRR